MSRRLRILTWHVHGNYLWYLSHARHDFFLVTRPGEGPGYAGRGGDLPFGPNVHEVPASELAEHHFDVVLYQHATHWRVDRALALTAKQRTLQTIVLEHDPPREHPTDTRHPAADSDAHIVHVTAFNAAMWDNGSASTSVIEHGVVVPEGVAYSGERGEGIVVVNHLAQRGRRLGADIFERVRHEVPLVLAGMDSTRSGGIGAVRNLELPALMGRHRFFFNPIRWTSLGLAMLEAMHVGLPVVALATTEIPNVIRNEVNGYADTRVERLVDVMRMLIERPEVAARWGAAGRAMARERFGIGRFAREWERLFERVSGRSRSCVSGRSRS